MRTREPHLIRRVAERTAELPSSGAMTGIQKRMAESAVAAVDGGVADAVAGLQEVVADLERLGQRYMAAVVAIDAATLLPDQAPIRALAEGFRPLLEELHAVADLEDLDRALASAAPAATEPRGASASAPARPPG